MSGLITIPLGKSSCWRRYGLSVWHDKHNLGLLNRLVVKHKIKSNIINIRPSQGIDNQFVGKRCHQT